MALRLGRRREIESIWGEEGIYIGNLREFNECRDSLEFNSTNSLRFNRYTNSLRVGVNGTGLL